MHFSAFSFSLLAVIGGCFAANLTIPFEFPLFKQCDSAWGEDIMVTKTICDVGCLMSSTAMALNGTHIPITTDPYEQSNPGTFNVWLQNNDGYTDDNNLIETQVPLIDPSRITWPEDAFHTENDLPYLVVADYLRKGRIVIANVMDGGHFVLLTGFADDLDTFAVNDPGFERSTYSYRDDVVGYRIFDMIRE